MYQSCPDRWLHIPQELHEDEWDKSNTRLHKVYITLVMLAAAFLVSICVHQSRPLPVPSPPPVAAPAPGVIALTTSEVRHLLARLVWPAPTSAALICQWSCWRRAHQYWAGYSHRRRHQKADEALALCGVWGGLPCLRPLLFVPGISLGKTARSSPGNLPQTFLGKTPGTSPRKTAGKVSRPVVVLVTCNTKGVVR